MMAGYFFYPGRGDDSTAVDSVLPKLAKLFNEANKGIFDTSPREWESDAWLGIKGPVCMVIIHPNDMPNFASLLKARKIPSEWTKDIDKNDKSRGKRLKEWLKENPEEKVLEGAIGCLSFVCKGAVLLFFSDGKIECKKALQRNLEGWDLKEKEDFFFFDAGRGGRISQDFLWEDFLNAGDNARLCDYWIDWNVLNSIMLSLLPLDIILQGIIETKKRGIQSLPYFPQNSSGGITKAPSECWFDQEELIDPDAPVDQRPFEFDHRIIDWASQRLSKDKARFLRNSVHPEDSLDASLGYKLTSKAVAEPKAGALRLIWEWIKSEGDPNKLKSAFNTEKDLTEKNFQSLCKAGHAEYLRLTQLLIKVMELSSK